jgi:four helix bundle protein
MTNDECVMTKEVPSRNDGPYAAERWYNSSGDDEFWRDPEAASGLLLRDGNTAPEPVYDLEERTASFGEAVIRFAKKVPRHPVNDRLVDQLVGAAASVGANYAEADDGVSKNDFRHRIGICRKEAREAKHFLRMVAVAEESLKPEARVLWQETKQLHLIFCAIWRKTS